jgi:exopolyphosphatase/guanosine-5'-triphosphate,3'-diphosphate pyrophosphatase
MGWWVQVPGAATGAAAGASRGIIGAAASTARQAIIALVERIAVIDMGSNSFRLVVYGYEPGSWWALSDEIREAVRVGAGMGESGLLQPGPVDRALHTAVVFDSFCQASGVGRVDAVATSAIRDAANRDELLGAIRESTGLEPRVLTGPDEARYGYLAIANSTTLEEGFGIDVGGGSVQLMRIQGRQLTDSISVPLGAVRLSEAFLPGEEASGKKTKALRAHVAETLEDVGWWKAGDSSRLAGIGGTVRNLAAAAIKAGDLPPIDVQGFELTLDGLDELIDELASRPASKRGGVRGIKPDRGDVILGGALALAAAMEHGGFEALEVCEAGLREGIFFEHLLDGRDPPLFHDVRRGSVENLSHRFRTNPEHVEHVAALSSQIYAGLCEAGLHEDDPTERELLWAACMLHDVGMTIDYDDHHRHSQYLILSSGLPGYSPRELMLVALVARWHRKGEPDASELGELERKKDGSLLLLLCGVIRLAEQLERSRDQVVRSVELEATKSRLSVAAHTNGRGADPSVALWSAQRNADLLGRAVDREVEVAQAQRR